jgi:hypothetical protein
LSLLALILLTGAVFFGGCDIADTQKQSDAQMLRDIQTFRNTYSSSLDYVGNDLNRRNASLSETEVVKSGLQGFMADRFGTNSGTYTNAIAAFESRAARASTPHRKSSDLVESLPPNVQGVVHDTEEALQASASYDAFSEGLHQIEQRFWTQNGV